MGDLQQLVTSLDDAWQALALEMVSVWLWLQLGLILLAAFLAGIIAAIVRRRVDLVTLTMGWPAPLRLLIRTLAANVGPIVFLILTGFARVALLSATLPARSYLLGVVTSFATAWVVIAVVAGFIRNRFIYRLVSISAWTMAALSIVGL